LAIYKVFLLITDTTDYGYGLKKNIEY